MLEFEVKDMTCGHCVSTITRAVKEEVPSASVEADLDMHLVRVGGTPDSKGVEQAIREAGYTPVSKGHAREV
jgi:copper chaperone